MQGAREGTARLSMAPPWWLMAGGDRTWARGPRVRNRPPPEYLPKLYEEGVTAGGESAEGVAELSIPWRLAPGLVPDAKLAAVAVRA